MTPVKPEVSHETIGQFCRDPHQVRMHGTVVVGTKGQIVIPSGVRSELNINSGDQMFVVTKHGKLVGLIKTDDMEMFINYMQQEMEVLKNMAKAANTPAV